MSILEYIFGASYVVTTLYTLMQIQKVRKQELRKEIREEIRAYIYSENFTHFVSRAIDQSNTGKRVDELVITLCTKLDELKGTKLCG